MPAGFDHCRANGGSIRTVSGPNKEFGLSKNQYMHICTIGKQFERGEIKSKKVRKPKPRPGY